MLPQMGTRQQLLASTGYNGFQVRCSKSPLAVPELPFRAPTNQSAVRPGTAVLLFQLPEYPRTVCCWLQSSVGVLGMCDKGAAGGDEPSER